MEAKFAAALESPVAAADIGSVRACIEDAALIRDGATRKDRERRGWCVLQQVSPGTAWVVRASLRRYGASVRDQAPAGSMLRTRSSVGWASSLLMT